jgi:hypothetical protein
MASVVHSQFKYATTTSVAVDGNTAWTNSSRATQPDSLVATSAPIGSASTSSITLSGYGFSIPSGATIKGIQAVLIGSTINPGSVDSSVTLSGGAGASADYASFAEWGTMPTYGGAVDLWGTTWTAAQIASIAIVFQGNNTSETVSPYTISLDACSLQIFYTVPNEGGTRSRVRSFGRVR